MGVFLRVMTKVPGIFKDRITLGVFGYTTNANFGMLIPEAYEKLIYDSIQRDNSLFVNAEEQL